VSGQRGQLPGACGRKLGVAVGTDPGAAWAEAVDACELSTQHITRVPPLAVFRGGPSPAADFGSRRG